MSRPRAVRVVLADDSALVRVGLRRALSGAAGLAVVGEAGTAAEALAEIERWRPDVLVLGLELPGGGALEVLERAPGLSVRVLALAAGPVRGPIAQALAASALEALEKPPSWDGPGALRLQERVRAAARDRATGGPRLAPKRAQDRAASGTRLLAVGASTGGPPEVARLLAALPLGAHPPVVVVQHTDAGGIAPLAEWLTKVAGRPVRAARHGEVPGAGDVRLAPAGRHLVVNGRGHLELHAAVAPSLHVPSADALFLSLAMHLGPLGGGVVLSGMGDDGSRGLLALRDAGGATWVQSPGTAAAPGMPEAALAAHAVDRALPMAQLVTAVRDWMEA